MAENTRMKEMQAQLASILSWIEKQPARDKDNRELIIQFQTANNDRMDQMQKSLDLLNQDTTQHVDASNSKVSPLEASTGYLIGIPSF